MLVSEDPTPDDKKVANDISNVDNSNIDNSNNESLLVQQTNIKFLIKKDVSLEEPNSGKLRSHRNEV